MTDDPALTPTLTTYEREQLAAVAAGEMPLAVYADWLEENGDERSEGARWLAEHAKWPHRVGVGWWWPSLEREPIAGLPPSVRARMSRTREPFRAFADALFSGVNATTDRLSEGPIDERAELLALYTRPHPGSAAIFGYSSWLLAHERPLARGVAWLVTRMARPGIDPQRGGFWWERTSASEVGVQYLGNVLPRPIFDRLRDGRRTGVWGRGRFLRYDDVGTALHDAARAVEEALDAVQIRNVPEWF